MSDKVLVLMATYNGEAFVAEQIDSIIRQTHQAWELWIRDDGSTDRTLEIVQDYAAKRPERIRVIRNDTTSLGACENFSELIKHAWRSSDAPFIALADQDDVWMADKLACQVEAIKRVPDDTPGLVFSDLSVVDKNLRMIGPSFWEMEAIDPVGGLAPTSLLSRNIMTGCTILMNRPLLDRIEVIPPEAIMHDWWIALAASVVGEVIALHKPLVQYRQHGANAIGAQYGDTVTKAKKLLLSPLNEIRRMERLHRQQARQARRLLEWLPESHPFRKEAECYASARDGSVLERLRHYRFFGCHKHSAFHILVP